MARAWSPASSKSETRLKRSYTEGIGIHHRTRGCTEFPTSCNAPLSFPLLRHRIGGVTIRSAVALPLALALATVSLALSAGSQPPAPGSAARGPQVPQEGRDRAGPRGRLRVLVEVARDQGGARGAGVSATRSS